MDFGSHLGSIFSHFPIILHSFFDHRFRIDFSLILGWIFHRFSIIFAYKFRSATEPREPRFFSTVPRSAPKIEFLPSSIFHVFLVFFDPDFTWILHRFLMVFYLHFRWLLHHFSILFRSRNLIDFWMAFLMDFYQKWSQRASFVGPLGSFWLPFGSILVAFGTLSAPFWIILAPLLSMLVPFSIKNHPFRRPNTQNTCR